MGPTEYNLLLDNAKARLSEAQADVEAIERVRRMKAKIAAEKNGQAPSSVPPDAASPLFFQPKPPIAGRGNVMKAIRGFIAAAHGTFTVLDIYAAIAATGPVAPKKQSIKAALGSLEKKGEVETVTRGIGRTPSVYRRKK